ncbi:capsule assembly Wzi family protein [Mucilaginibacter calamicampi]|uniref:Capsule assembly Wzi family protein n=1 Tax=Mucilaginibacter calamicampi TaxID=1302352 RepID=A0ABW2YWG9_9SPHI
MKKVLWIVTIISGITVILSNKLVAQSIPVGAPLLDDYYRRMQLLGKVDSNVSFTVRPIFAEALKATNVFDPEGTLKKSETLTSTDNLTSGRAVLRLLPLTWQQQFNTHHPYGWNDGVMIPAKGYQTLVSGGLFFKYGVLTIQLRPEFVYAANNQFEGYAVGHNDTELTHYYTWNNYIDQPERFGTTPYRKLFWGQSSIRLTFGKISMGLSNENLWWGPGINNSLILSNNAGGFKHLTLNTVKPIQTKIGAFEGQIIAGKLDGSGYSPLPVTTTSAGLNLLNPKRQEWRYFTGLNLNYHPKWVPGLTLGLTRTFNSYHSDVKGISGYFPFFFTYFKANTVDANGDPFERDQYTSLYARWLFTKAQAEVYFEFGVNDNSYNVRDFVLSPDHARAYIFGFRKMIPVNGKKNQNILIGAEITQLAQSPERMVRGIEYWYIHAGVRHGHTQQGQILGAGIGPGSNLQSAELSWVSGLKKIGIKIDRYDHNLEFSKTEFKDIDGNKRNWVDIAFGLQGDWDYKNLLLSAKLQTVKSLNYNWLLKNYTPNSYYIPNNTVYNLHGELGLTYRF